MKKYIKETLDSIENQTWFKKNKNFEVLVGVDGCYETMTYLQSIMNEYTNLRVFMMQTNKGTYITTNTLISIAKYENIIRFDSDDVMYPFMIETLMNNSENVDFLRFHMKNFGNEKTTMLSWGQFLVKHDVFDWFGSFMPWPCTGDGEFIFRVKKFVVVKILDIILFKRRVHSSNLTVLKKTKYGSKFRKIFENYVDNIVFFNQNMNNAIIFTILNKYYEIFPNICTKKNEYEFIFNLIDNKFNNDIKVIASFTSFKNRLQTTIVDEMIKSLLTQTIKPYKIVMTLYIDDGQYMNNYINSLIDDNIIELLICYKELKSHKKYFYIMQKFKDYPIITFNDNLIYENSTIESLIKSYKKYPYVISARFVNKILFGNELEKEKLESYNNWIKHKELKPSFSLFPINGAGSLFPPNILEINDNMLFDIYKCLNVDDVYLKYLEMKKKIKIIYVKNDKPLGLKNNHLNQISYETLYLYENNIDECINYLIIEDQLKINFQHNLK